MLRRPVESAQCPSRQFGQPLEGAVDAQRVLVPVPGQVVKKQGGVIPVRFVAQPAFEFIDQGVRLLVKRGQSLRRQVSVDNIRVIE